MLRKRRAYIWGLIWGWGGEGAYMWRNTVDIFPEIIYSGEVNVALRV